MNNALKIFKASIADARSLTGLYDFLVASVPSPYSYDDLLRSQIVYAVSAFDKLLHDVIRVGMVATYCSKRTATAKYHSESISIQFHGTLVSASLPPKEVLFEQEIARKLKVMSFQDPQKVADGLSYIWDEKNKWDKIAGRMGLNPDNARTKLKLIADRRNAIVHESDMDPISSAKNPIVRSECSDLTDFVELCGTSIVELLI